MWHKMQIFVILLIVIVHEYGVNACKKWIVIFLRKYLCFFLDKMSFFKWKWILIYFIISFTAGTAPKKLKKKDIFNPHDHYLHDERTKFPGRLTCLECDSKNDENCKSNPSDEKLVDCLYPHLCYHFRNVSSGDTQRGKRLNEKRVYISI